MKQYFGEVPGSESNDGLGATIARDHFTAIARTTSLPGDFSNAFMYWFAFGINRILFVGEDTQSELARRCGMSDFNSAVWPMLYDICRSNSGYKRQQERIKELHEELRRTGGEIGELARKLRHRAVDPHSFYEISNRLFTIYDQQRLAETFAESVMELLQAALVTVYMQDPENKQLFKKAIAVGDTQRSIPRELTLAPESQLHGLLLGKHQPLTFPVINPALTESDPVVEAAIAGGLTLVEKLQVGTEIRGLVFVAQKTQPKQPGSREQFSDADLEAFSTLANIASLALANVHHYMLIERMSYTDSMTELYNYRYFYKRLNEEIFRAKRYNRLLALVIFDIDNFKAFNDTYGHLAGNEILRNLAILVTESVRVNDVVSRYGGEEFCVIMPDTGYANCLIFIERLRRKIEDHRFSSEYVEGGYQITISIGAAIYPNDTVMTDRLIYSADIALLKAKADGRNRSVMFNSSLLQDDRFRQSSQAQLTDPGTHDDT